MKKALLYVVVSLILAGSAFAAEAPLPQAQELSADDQTKKAFEVFQSIYKLTEEGERAKVLSQIEDAYLEIVTKYPKSSIVHESYWRLITIYLVEHKPPQFDKAETLYGEFIRKYPESQTKWLISDTIAGSYHQHARWDRLLRFLTPPVKQFIATGAIARPQEMFFYSEAKFNLGDLAEAEKGYKIVASFFPESKEARTARTRLDEIHQRKSKLP